MKNELKTAASLSKDEAVLNQLTSRGREQSAIQSMHSSRWGPPLG